MNGGVWVLTCITLFRPLMSEESNSLPLTALLPVMLVALLGTGSLGWALATWDSPDLLKFAVILVVAMFFASVKVEVPGASGSLPITFLFVLYGVLNLTLPETVVLAILVTAVQCCWNEAKRPPLPQIAFHVATAALASAATAWAYDSQGVAQAVSGYQASGLILLAAATVLLFVLNGAPIAMAVAWAEGVSFFATWREFYFWCLPYYLGGALLAEAANFATRFLGWPTVFLSAPVIYLIFRSYRLYVSRLEDQMKHAEAVSALQLRTIEALALAIEAKDDTTHDHLARVQVYAREMGKDLGLTEDEQEALRAASILHDIGKLAVPEHIISKPGRLTPEEFDKMKIHPIVGAEILEQVQFPYPVAPIVRAHHEKWDGSGYPYGLKGEEIPIGARILSAVDCLDALSTDRQYRRALPLDEAMKVVQQESGKAFDPRVVDVLMRRHVELEKMAKAQQAATKSSDAPKLSKDIKIAWGLAPAAGFEFASPIAAPAAGAQPGDFLASIAAARQEVQALFEIAQTLGNSLSLDETLSVLGMRLRHVIPHHSLAIWLRHGDVLRPEYVAGDDSRLFSTLEIPVGQGLSGWVAENCKAIVNGNPSVESGYLGDTSKFSTLRSAIAVPLEGLTGVVGVLAMYHADRDAFNKDHLRILLAINSKIALSIENAVRFRQFETSATTDYLTNLPNARSLFVQLDGELARSRRLNQALAVLVLDLDGFKQINDRFGHLEGNRVLRAVANGFKSVCREYDAVGRMGGDEFVVILGGGAPGEIGVKYEQLRAVVSQVCSEMAFGQLLTVSIGAAHYPRDGTDAEGLLAVADRNMYAEKQQRKPKANANPFPPRADQAERWDTTISVQ